MAMLGFLFILVLLPSFKALSYEPIHSEIQTQDMQALIAQACMDIENQNSCLTNIHNELTKIGPPSPTLVMSAALKATLNEALVAIDNMTKITTFSVSYREQQAIEDCKELLDFLVSELAWSLGEMQRICAGDTNVQYEGNLEAWLSAALSNQDTCLEGFEGTNRSLESYISGSLTQLHTLPFKPPRNTTIAESDGTSEFPEWMSEGDQELLRAKPHGVRADAIVALDGSGHYGSIAEAVNAASSHSARRYIIYVKKGLYKENVDMKKKMTNIMLVGDGIGQTIITSNRNFMQGWTTFRTATLGN
ncbi:pectinesterase [Vigna unguiculata]|uniref:Pectinesterase n=1 Tax=Vigna unguiculata TaxID=3917 RepID=A0A4D6M299_VIGUN|nr:pectinesterase [Vigna unguiculata]